MRVLADDLLQLFTRAVGDCAADRLVARSSLLREVTEPCDLVVLGKCAVAAHRGARPQLDVVRSLIVVPAGYGRLDGSTPAEVHYTSHPLVSAASFTAGQRLQSIVRASSRPLVVIVSGGSSAAIEAPLAPWVTTDDLLALQRPLLAAGLDIEAMNTARKHLSAIKGGRSAIAPRQITTLIVSDVDPAKPYLVGSGPTMPDPTSNEEAAHILESLAVNATHDAQLTSRIERICASLRSEMPDTPKQLTKVEVEVVGDNETLKRRAEELATELGYATHLFEGQIAGDVDAAADQLICAVLDLPPQHLLIAGGEVTVRVAGNGRGGRCSELAARVARRLLVRGDAQITALFAGSDGVDGNSGAAGVMVEPEKYLRSGTALIDRIGTAIDRSDTISVADALGRPIRMDATGNNLRDLFMLAHG